MTDNTTYHVLVHDLIMNLSLFLDKFEAEKRRMFNWSRCSCDVVGHSDAWIFFDCRYGLQLEHYKISKSVIMNSTMTYEQKYLSCHVVAGDDPDLREVIYE